ncbi:hypothetical protein EJD97_016539 [Solanum chilense]|uniref:Protein phosphatase n=1 Tax=Solanum chilense TaxID=4083 RepID=A0A6N2B5Q4_SOLCI|nr:hypothetical protein EJD97_016539 [Solanum chilense]
MAACISSLGHEQYSSNNFNELFNLPRYKRYLDFSSHEVNDHLDNHSNKRLKFSQDDEFFNVEKRKPLGEDAHFIDELFKTIGVADGVGGWAKQGIDAGIYSRELMKNSHIVTYYEAMKGHVNPKGFLKKQTKTQIQKDCLQIVL